MKIKEISIVDLGLHYNWDVTKYQYFKNGIDFF